MEGERGPDRIDLLLEVVERAVVVEDVIAEWSFAFVGDHAGEATCGFGFEVLTGGWIGGSGAGCEAGYFERFRRRDENQPIETAGPLDGFGWPGGGFGFAVFCLNDERGLDDDDGVGIAGEGLCGKLGLERDGCGMNDGVELFETAGSEGEMG